MLLCTLALLAVPFVQERLERKKRPVIARTDVSTRLLGGCIGASYALPQMFGMITGSPMSFKSVLSQTIVKTVAGSFSIGVSYALYSQSQVLASLKPAARYGSLIARSRIYKEDDFFQQKPKWLPDNLTAWDRDAV